MSVFSSNMQAQSSVQLTQEMKRETALSTLSAEEVLGRRLGYVTGSQGTRQKWGFLSTRMCSLQSQTFLRAAGRDREQGSDVSRVPGGKGETQMGKRLLEVMQETANRGHLLRVHAS